MTMSKEENKKSFWTSLPGILTGIGAVIAAIGSIVAVQFGGNTLNPGVAPESAAKPIADAGIPKTVNEGDIVTLDSTNSHDPDGKIVGYEWVQTDGIPVILNNNYVANPTFKTPDVPQDRVLTFKLRVRDDSDILSAPRTVTVTIKNVPQPPLSDDKNITSDQIGEEVNTTTNPSTSPSPSPARLNNPATPTTAPSNTNVQVTLAHETNFIPEELRNPGLKSFTHTVKVMVNAPPQILSLIENVTYYPPQRGLTSFNQPQIRYSPGDNFAFSFNALDDFGLKAKVYFKDGKAQDLSTSISFR
jgi:hypothetical protein